MSQIIVPTFTGHATGLQTLYHLTNAMKQKQKNLLSEEIDRLFTAYQTILHFG